MGFEYDIINQISNQDFKDSYRSLSNECDKINKKYNSQDYRGCCKDVREVNEVIVRYMDERLLGYSKTQRTAGVILLDEKFRDKFDDTSFLYPAAEVQRIGSKYIHSKPKTGESQEQFERRIKRENEILPKETDEILEKFSEALKAGITFINEKIPGVRGVLKIIPDRRISDRTGVEESVLLADLTDVRNRKDYIYTWKFKEQDTKYKEGTYFIILNRDWMENKTVILKATNTNTNQELIASYGPIKKEELVIKEKNKKPIEEEIKSTDCSSATTDLPGEKPKGYIEITKSENFKGSCVKLDVSLHEADFRLQDSDVSIEWGYIDNKDLFVPITKDKKLLSFKCYLNKGSIGKPFSCRVFRQSFREPLTAVFRKLTEEDFAIMGVVTIKFDRPTYRLKASVANPNYQGKPKYIWYRNGKIQSETSQYLQISADDIGNAFVCEITHDELTLSKKSEPYIVKECDIDSVTALAEAETDTPVFEAGNKGEGTIDQKGSDVTVADDMKHVSTETKYVLHLSVDTLDGEKVILFNLDPPIDIDKYTVNWTIIKSTGEEEKRSCKDSHLLLNKLAAGDTVICEVYSPKGEFLAKSDLSLIKDYFTVPEKEPEIVDSSAGKSGSSSKHSILGFDFEKPEILSSPDFSCFNTNISRLHYFIAPRFESYATNSLRFLDYYAFLNALLKDQGFERVIIVQHNSHNKGDNFPVITYSKKSELTFLHPEFSEACENVDDKNRAIQDFCDRISSKKKFDASSIRAGFNGVNKGNKEIVDSHPLFGKRRIRIIVPTDSDSNEDNKNTYAAFLQSYVIPALEQTYLKTAIVFPIELLEKKDYLDAMNAANLRDQIQKPGNNALIITADQASALSSLFDIGEYKTIEPEVFNVISDIEESSDPISRSFAIVDALSVKKTTKGEQKNTRILIADDRPGIDEIANLLMIKKIEEAEEYKRLSISKIYGLAEFLYSSCESVDNTKQAFPNLSDNTWTVTSLANFSLKLDDKAIRDRIIEKGTSLFDRTISYTADWKSTCVERIYTRIGIVLLKVGRKLKCSGISPITKAAINKFERDEMIKNSTLELNSLIGLAQVKEQLKTLLQAASNNVFTDNPGPGHYIFSGNPGTGKTTVARLFGKILHSQGILKKGHLVEIKKADIVADHVGGTQVKAATVFERALDGVLFLDEAYELVNTESTGGLFNNDFDKEAYTLLMKFMEDNRTRVCVICAGYPGKMKKFLDANEGMGDRFSSIIDFPDYSAEELFQILEKDLKDKTRLRPSLDYLNESRKIMKYMHAEAASGLEQFGNARTVRKYAEESISNAAKRNNPVEILPEDIPEKYKPIDVNSEKMTKLRKARWEELNNLIGLDNIKKQLQIKITTSMRAAGRNKVPGHYAFVGNPGTGKTEVARLMPKILFTCGLLKTDHLVEVKAKDIIGQYVGQSGPLAEEKCKEALDGVLFIDEAYSMVNAERPFGNVFISTFAQESYETIMKFMEDHRQRICVIFAGYKDEMNVFLDANPGMRSRVTAGNIIEFDDYSDDELIEIMDYMAVRRTDFHIVITDEFRDATKKILPNMRNVKAFGNARDIRTYLDECQGNAITRIPYEKRIVLEDGVEQLILTDKDIPDRLRAKTNYIAHSKNEKYAATSSRTVSSPRSTDKYLAKDKLYTLPNPFLTLKQQEFIDHCKQATVRIKGNGFGTAFIITPDGYGITCAHVIMGQKFDCYTKNGIAYYLGNEQITFDVKLIRQDFDLALIKLNSSHPLPYLAIASEDSVVNDLDSGHLFGFPDGEPEIKYGIWNVSSEEEPKGDGTLGTIQYISVLGFPGDSGGPVVSDQTGLVVGVLQGAKNYSNDEKLMIMKPIRYVWKEFTKNQI